jgi:hypothetical protein
MFQKDLTKRTRFIKYKKGGKLWRPNSNDPYIYISFDLTQLNTYEELDTIKSLQNEFGVSQIKTQVLHKLIQILQQEWIEKAKLPIRFLSKEASAEEVIKKNVCFIISTNLTPLEMENKLGRLELDTTNGALDIANQGTYYSHFKVIRIPKLPSLDHIDNGIIQQYLHELGHALCELKHFKKYSKDDQPPFSNAMTCEDSVMSYWDTCPPILKAMKENPYDRELWKAKYPTTLGPVDLAAAVEFIDEFKARNLKHAGQLKTLGYDPYLIPTLRNSQAADRELSIAPMEMSYLAAWVNYFEESLLAYAKDVVDSCPSYFPKNLSNNSSLFQEKRPICFFQTPQCYPMIANTPIPCLPK